MKRNVLLFILLGLGIILYGCKKEEIEEILPENNISTNAEIYDFEVGDVFHIRSPFEAPGYSRLDVYNIEILDKKYSDTNNLTYIRYIRDIDLKYSENGNPYVYEYYTDTIYCYNPDSLVHEGIIDTVYTNPDLYNERKINEVLYYGATYQKWQFVNGCGEALWRYNDMLNYVSFENRLVYYKKGTEEWGTPIIVGIQEIFNNSPRISTFPNPFTTSTTIEYELKEISNIQFTIYNAMGEVVYMAEDRMMPQGKHGFTWKPEGLPEGMYYAVLRSEKGVSVIKMIKQ